MPAATIITALLSIIILCIFYLPFAIVPLCGARWKKKAIPGKRPFAIAAIYATALMLFQFLFYVLYTAEWMDRLSSSSHYSGSQSDPILNLIINIIFVVIPLAIMAIALYAKSDIALIIGVGFNTLGYFATIIFNLIQTFSAFAEDGLHASTAIASRIPSLFMIHIPCLLAWVFMLVGAILCARKKGAGIFKHLWHMPLVLSLFYTIIHFSEFYGMSGMSQMFLLFATLLQPGFVFALGWWIAHTSDPEFKKVKAPAYVNAQPMYAPFEPAPANPYYNRESTPAQPYYEPEPAQQYYNPEPTPMQSTYAAPVQNTYAEPVQSYAAPVTPAPEQNIYTPPAQSYHEYASERAAEKPVDNLSDNTVVSLKKYKALLDDGIINQAEFDDIKKRLLNS